MSAACFSSFSPSCRERSAAFCSWAATSILYEPIRRLNRYPARNETVTIKITITSEKYPQQDSCDDDGSQQRVDDSFDGFDLPNAHIFDLEFLTESAKGRNLKSHR